MATSDKKENRSRPESKSLTLVVVVAKKRRGKRRNKEAEFAQWMDSQLVQLENKFQSFEMAKAQIFVLPGRNLENALGCSEFNGHRFCNFDFGGFARLAATNDVREQSISEPF